MGSFLPQCFGPNTNGVLLLCFLVNFFMTLSKTKVSVSTVLYVL